MMQEELIDFIHKEERKYRSAAQAEPLSLRRDTDLKTAELFTVVGEMLEDYLIKDCADRKSLLEQHGIPDKEELKDAC